jgi:hypothetical protein
MVQDLESVRLAEARTAKTPWKKRGPYLSERPFARTTARMEMPRTTSLMTRPDRDAGALQLLKAARSSLRTVKFV